MFNLFSISGLTRSLEVAYEARAATGKPGKTEDCGWRGSCESISFCWWCSGNSAYECNAGFLSGCFYQISTLSFTNILCNICGCVCRNTHDHKFKIMLIRTDIHRTDLEINKARTPLSL